MSDKYKPAVCEQDRGQCTCKSHVIGRQCDECEAGFWNLTSGTVRRNNYMETRYSEL